MLSESEAGIDRCLFFYNFLGVFGFGIGIRCT